LGVTEDADEVVIRAAYRALAQKYHPDKWVGDKSEANIKMKEINEAYSFLERYKKENSGRHENNQNSETINSASQGVSSGKAKPKVKDDDFKNLSTGGKIFVYLGVTIIFGIGMGLIKWVARYMNSN
jgi:DnaJ-class molecular chaperone